MTKARVLTADTIHIGTVEGLRPSPLKIWTTEATADLEARATLPPKVDHHHGFGMPPSRTTTETAVTIPPKVITRDAVDTGIVHASAAGRRTTSEKTALTAKKTVLAKGKILSLHINLRDPRNANPVRGKLLVVQFFVRGTNLKRYPIQ